MSTVLMVWAASNSLVSLLQPEAVFLVRAVTRNHVERNDPSSSSLQRARKLMFAASLMIVDAQLRGKSLSFSGEYG